MPNAHCPPSSPATKRPNPAHSVQTSTHPTLEHKSRHQGKQVWEGRECVTNDRRLGPPRAWRWPSRTESCRSVLQRQPASGKDDNVTTFSEGRSLFSRSISLPLSLSSAAAIGATVILSLSISLPRLSPSPTPRVDLVRDRGRTDACRKSFGQTLT